MSDLKDQLIKLGSAHPELRDDLRVILAHVVGQEDRSKVARTLQVGETFENDIIRVHRFQDSLKLTLLENAGKRGKQVEQWSFVAYGKVVEDSTLSQIAEDLLMARSVQEVMQVVEKVEQGLYDGEYPNKVKSFYYKLKGVDVKPAGFKPITLTTPNIHILADYDSFTIRDMRDPYNEPTCIPAISGGKRDIPVFYRWVKDNESLIRRMTFAEVQDAMTALGIKYHYYCAMD
jgi:hypothetical protein